MECTAYTKFSSKNLERILAAFLKYLQIALKRLHHVAYNHIRHDKISSRDLRHIKLMLDQGTDLCANGRLTVTPALYICPRDALQRRKGSGRFAIVKEKVWSHRLL